MNPRIATAAALALLAAAGLAVRLGRPDNLQNLDAVFTLWGDVLSDASRTAALPLSLSPAEEMLLGNRLANQVRAVYSADTVHQPAVERVGRRLSATSLVRTSYTFLAIEESSINAFALPGGHVFVTRGLAEFVKSDAELALVMGHEMAHNELGHCLEGHRYQTVLSRFGVRDAGLLMDSMQQALSLAYSREQEFEADERGMALAAQTYDVRPAIGVFDRLAALEPSRPRGWLAPYLETHPPAAERSARLRKSLRLPQP